MSTDRSSLAYLDAMGVEVWVRRNHSQDDSQDDSKNSAAPAIANDQPDIAAADAAAVAPPDSAVSQKQADTSAQAAPEGSVAPTAAADAATAPNDVQDDAVQPAAAAVADDLSSTANANAAPADTDPSADGDQDIGNLIAKADLESLQTMVSGCERCSLAKSRNKTVFGSGNPNADWLFVGEAPGRDEDRQGEAFVGKAGQLLNSMLFALGLTRDDVFIANVLKCRPPDNRDPMGEEVVQCEPYLHRQVDLVQPKVIVAMGRFAAQALLQSGDNISRMRSREYAYRDTGIPLVVTYHPAYLLRTPDQKGKVWNDLLQARRIINGG